VKMPGPLAAVVAKVDATKDLSPRTFGVFLLIGGAMLVWGGLDRKRAAAPS
jgi:hypothetical protein